jgi:hypothetical protein
MWNIFEQPWTLLITAVVLALFVAVINPFIEAKSKRLLWLIPLLVAVAAPLLDFAVETDREKIQGVINAGVNALENENAAGIAAIVAEDYHDSMHRDKAALVRHCRAVLRPPLIDKVFSSVRQMEITGRTAAVTVLNRIFFDPKSEVAQRAQVIIVEVKVDLQKNPDGNWLITHTEIQAVNGKPASWSNVNYENW